VQIHGNVRGVNSVGAYWVRSLVGDLCTLGLLAGLVPFAHAQAVTSSPPVVVAKAEIRLLAPVTWFPGAVISRDDAKLAAEVEGRLVQVADVGTQVQKGAVVARLDDTLLREQLAESEASVAREQARLAYYTQEVERLRPLVDRKIVTPSNLDQAVSNRDATRGELAAARARVMWAKGQLQRTVIRAPFAGVVTERILQPGEWAESGGAIIRLVNPRALEVQARVPANALGFIREGSELNLMASPERLTAKVRTIVPVGDDRSRLYELRLTLSNAKWPAGQTVRVEVPTAAAREVVAVPRDALVLRRTGTSVFRIRDDDTAERVTVSTGIAAGEFIEVSNGIQPGDRVVIRGGERLRNGQKVKVLITPPKS
jgi:RND family efflux transporter MFP subunit